VAGEQDDADLRNRLGHDVVCGHVILPGYGSEPGLDLEQLVPVLIDFMVELGAAQQQHAAEFVNRDPVEQLPDLGEREPEFPERYDPVDLA
jgi:hypothetical protein